MDSRFSGPRGLSATGPWRRAHGGAQPQAGGGVWVSRGQLTAGQALTAAGKPVAPNGAGPTADGLPGHRGPRVTSVGLGLRQIDDGLLAVAGGPEVADGALAVARALPLESDRLLVVMVGPAALLIPELAQRLR